MFIFHKNIDSNFPRGFGMRENFLAFDQYNYIFLPLLITFSAQNNIQKARKIPRWNETLILPRISNAPNVSGLACRFKTLYLQKSHFLFSFKNFLLKFKNRLNWKQFGWHRQLFRSNTNSSTFEKKNAKRKIKSFKHSL